MATNDRVYLENKLKIEVGCFTYHYHAQWNHFSTLYGRLFLKKIISKEIEKQNIFIYSHT